MQDLGTFLIAQSLMTLILHYSFFDILCTYISDMNRYFRPLSTMKTQKNRIKNSGFTLIITISLLVLLTLIAIGLLSLSTVTLRIGSKDQLQAVARANARMALMMAIGELQKELGPDRRVNCQAGIDTAAVAEHRQWVGVYDAWNASESTRPEPAARFRRYLVSGDPTTLRNRSAANAALPGRTVNLVDNGGGTSLRRVRVGLVPLGNASGNYGWWVGDENAKAKINAGRDIPAAINNELLALEAGQSAPGVGFRMQGELSSVNGVGRAPWDMGDGLRSKCVSLASAELLPGMSGDLTLYDHDLTTSSYGLLTDVRNGGLKRDLSLYLEQPYSSRLRQPLYTVSGNSTVNFSPDGNSAVSLSETSGITMEELWIYYNLYKEVSYNRPASNDDMIGRRPSGFPTLLSGNSRDAVVADRFYPYKRRVYSQVKYMLSLAAAPSTAQAGRFDLRIAIDPVVILWNPYNVALEYQTGGFTTVGFSGLPYVAEFQTPSGTVTVPFSQFFPNGNVNLIPANIGMSQSIILQPGESRVFSRVEGQGDSLSSGWRYTDGILINHANFPKNLQSDATVRLTLRPDTGGYVNYLTFWFGLRSQTPTWQSGTYILRGDRQAAALPTVTTPQTISVSNIVADKKIPHLLISQNMRTENETTTPSKTWLWSNPSIIFRQAADDSLAAKLFHQMEIFATQVNSWENPHVQITPGNQAYWGGGTRADFGVPFFTMRGVPLTPMKSIASFQHSCANGMRRQWKDSTVSIPASSFPSTAEGLDGHRYCFPMGSKLIGNSFAHPLIPASATRALSNLANDQAAPPVASSVTLADHSYLANAALWDTWYFSTMAPQTVNPYRANSRNLQRVFDDFFPVSSATPFVPLPTARFAPYRQGNETLLRALIRNGTAEPLAYQRLSSYLMVDGAFNVNSTSVNAWKMILGSLRGHSTTRMSPATGGLTVVSGATDTTPINGLGTATGVATTPSANVAEPTQWTGFRNLDDEQINQLANLLVQQIRQRGPFLSLSDFINRRPGSQAGLARQGALQAAIENSEINGALDKGTRALGNIAGTAFPEAGRGSKAAGIPGYITQADILTALGPVLQARSDTFTIRAYGNATDPYGNVVAEAWCEAVVQRVPEFINTVDAPQLRDANLTSQLNRVFGRKIRVVSYRWLTRNEV